MPPIVAFESDVVRLIQTVFVPEITPGWSLIEITVAIAQPVPKV